MSNEIKKVKKIWGNEEWIINNDNYCGKILNLKKGYRSSIHYHKNKHETFYLLEGRILLELDNKNTILQRGSVQTIGPYQKHRFTGLVDSKIIEFSTHHEDSDTYREKIGEKINLEELKNNLI